MSWVICACSSASARGFQGRQPGLYLDRRARQLSSCSLMQLFSSHLIPCHLFAFYRTFADHTTSLVSFSQLQKQIIDLAATHFKHLPVRPPHEDLAQVPHNLPSFLGDTPASRYVQHTTQYEPSLISILQTSPCSIHRTHSLKAYHISCLRALSF